jgi:hypothetical protein
VVRLKYSLGRVHFETVEEMNEVIKKKSGELTTGNDVCEF